MSMDARLIKVLLCAAALCSLGAGYRTQNFIVMAPTPQLAREIGDTAESLRRSLAIEWLGRELPPWRDPCPITAQVSPQLGAGGVTSFAFDNGRPFNWTMSIQGSHERVLDSVLPHEVTHTIFATHFGQPLPRWADEGACTTVEHPVERKRHDGFLVNFLMSDRGIAFNHMFAMKDYPRDIMPLYSQGYSVAKYLIAQGGKRKFVDYIGHGLRTKNWAEATRLHYGFKNLSDLQVKWLSWVRKGSPAQVTSEPEEALATNAATAGSTRLASGNVSPRATPAGFTDSSSAVASRSESSDAGDATSDGWYLRRRTEALKQGDQGRWPNVAAERSASANRGTRSTLRGGQANPADSNVNGYESVTRPQAPQRPKQTILEWSRSPETAAGPPPLHAQPPRP